MATGQGGSSDGILDTLRLRDEAVKHAVLPDFQPECAGLEDHGGGRLRRAADGGSSCAAPTSRTIANVGNKAPIVFLPDVVAGRRLAANSESPLTGFTVEHLHTAQAGIVQHDADDPVSACPPVAHPLACASCLYFQRLAGRNDVHSRGLPACHFC